MRSVAVAVCGALVGCTKLVVIPIAPTELPRLTARSAEEPMASPTDQPGEPQADERYEVERLDGRKVTLARPFAVVITAGAASFRFGDPVRSTLDGDQLVVEGRGRPRLALPVAAVTRVELRQRRLDGVRTLRNAGLVVGVTAVCVVVLGTLALSSAPTH